ncbi:MAG: radical SAM protein [Geobacteraceae bacterium]|nr:radical SAM protein [Geobacteraceae bacterium]
MKPNNVDITATMSLCPHCLARIPAERRTEGDDTFLVKSCPDHGEFRTPVWRGEPRISSWSRPKKPFHSGTHLPLEPRGCPFDCGICPKHRQQSCTVLIEVTGRCNLACQFCFAAAGTGDDPSLETIEKWYLTALEKSGPHNIIQLSGGEATLRDDLPAIITMGRELGFPFIQLNSNGVRLAADPAYARELKKAGLFSVFLQFDGTDDRIYQTIRGRALLAEKLKAIDHCAAAGLGVVLVPTIVAGVNSDNIGAILKLALELSPAVRGVHFQPASYFGRHPGVPKTCERVTLPDLMRAIEGQTGGLMKKEHFCPPGCEHPLCSFHGNFLRLPSGELKSLTTPAAECTIETVGTGRAVSYVAQQWSAPAPVSCCCDTNSLDAFLENHHSNTFAVSAMAFQDVWNLDLERVQECCIHVVAPDNRLIPFCLYNLTSAGGKPLYRRRPC